MTEYPAGVPLELDRSVRRTGAGRVLLGGNALRVLRLSVSGARALRRLLEAGADPSPSSRRLARTLVDGNLAHPRPPRASGADVSAAVTVVVPVRDRAVELDRCLAAAGAPALVADDGSRDAAAIAAVCARHSARLIRRAIPRGPGAARNTGVSHVETELVAFLDSDCVPEPDWLHQLIGHFADPLVGAVAPRARGAAPDGLDRTGAIATFAAVRSPIDLGAHPARVVPGGHVSYVPTAALVVRRSALGPGFDPSLRFGEDVDFVWRLHDAGWHVRYDPHVIVHHVEPTEWRVLAARRRRYGTSAAPLARRHPGRVAPLVISPWPAATVLLALAGRPGIAAASALLQALALVRHLRRASAPPSVAFSWSLRGPWLLFLTLGRTATMLTPAAVLAGAWHPRTRWRALVLLFASPLVEWWTKRPALDPVRWTALCIADDIAYGAGVWQGAWTARSPRAVMPILHRSRRS